MKRIVIDNIDQLAKLMKHNADDGETVYAALFFDDATELVRSLMQFKDVSIESIELEPAMYSGYDKEYYVVLDMEKGLYVEPAWYDGNDKNDGCYLGFDAEVFYVSSDANSSILKDRYGCKCIEFDFRDNCDCEDCDEDFDDELVESNSNHQYSSTWLTDIIEELFEDSILHYGDEKLLGVYLRV